MTKETLITTVTNSFKQFFNSIPQLTVLSPGRINLIGEHIDYNDGFVMPAAIDKYLCFAISKSNSKNCHISSLNMNDEITFSIDTELKPIEKEWANYFLGVIDEFKKRGHLIEGFNVCFMGNLPSGAGVSSSAALECGLAYCINEIFELNIDKKEIALIGQSAEHKFIGVMCGIMDQFACVFGLQNSFIKLDCSNLSYSYHSAEFGDYGLIMLNSGVKHSLVSSAYNDRRKDAEAGIAVLKRKFDHIGNYRDVAIEHLQTVKDTLGQVVYNRSLYIVNEIERVNAASIAIDENDFIKLGQLLYETHDGLSKLYEVSCSELDFLVEKTFDEPDVLGARMMGGGFGGCTINLVKKEAIPDFAKRMEQQYKTKFNIELQSIVVEISDGVKKV